MIEGNLRDAPLSDVLQIVVAGQKSGVLTLRRRASRARIYFDRGRVEYAYLRPGIHLGEILVRLEMLTHVEVQKILLEQDRENPGTPLGLMAVQRGFLSDHELRDALQAQVLEALTELMTWNSGTFSFSDRPQEASQVPTAHTLDTTALMMEVVKRLDEWQASNIKGNMRFKKVGDPTKVTVPHGGWEVLGLLDGKRNTSSVAAELELPERQVYRIFQDLLEQRLITQVPHDIEDPLVLVFSASEAMQRLMRLSLQRASLRVATALESDKATELIDKYHPKAIVIEDIHGEGWELVRELRKLPAQGHLPILVLSSDQNDGLLGRMRRPKATVLEKPFLEIEFQQAVTQLLGRSL
jgi:CheY-like chemotaxis protein